MTSPPPEDRRPAPPSVLEYARPSAASHDGPPSLSAAAVGALALAVLAAVSSLVLARHVFTYRPPSRLELLTPLAALVGVFLSVHALLRIADRKNRLWGDSLAWAALLLNMVLLLANGCCVSMRWAGGAM